MLQTKTGTSNIKLEPLAGKALTASEAEAIRDIVHRHRDKPGALLAILEEVQQKTEGIYLAKEAIWSIASELGESPSRVYSVATFYSNFNLKALGKHIITVCRGTACHTRGSQALLQEALSIMGITDYADDEESVFTSNNGLFTVRSIACFGQCALAPVLSIDGKIFSRMTSQSLSSLIQSISKGKKK